MAEHTILIDEYKKGKTIVEGYGTFKTKPIAKTGGYTIRAEFRPIVSLRNTNQIVSLCRGEKRKIMFALSNMGEGKSLFHNVAFDLSDPKELTIRLEKIEAQSIHAVNIDDDAEMSLCQWADSPLVTLYSTPEIEVLAKRIEGTMFQPLSLGVYIRPRVAWKGDYIIGLKLIRLSDEKLMNTFYSSYPEGSKDWGFIFAVDWNRLKDYTYMVSYYRVDSGTTPEIDNLLFSAYYKYFQAENLRNISDGMMGVPVE